MWTFAGDDVALIFSFEVSSLPLFFSSCSEIDIRIWIHGTLGAALYFEQVPVSMIGLLQSKKCHVVVDSIVSNRY